MISQFKRETIPGALGLFVEKYNEKIDDKLFYVVNLECRRFYQVDFTCDLTSAANLDVATEQLEVIRSTVAPFHKVEVLRVPLQKNWRLIPIFEVHERMPSKEQQKRALEPTWQIIKNLRRFWEKNPLKNVEGMKISELEEFLRNQEADFFDLDFPPCDRSVSCFGGSVYKMLDCFVHWRRSRDSKWTEEVTPPNNPMIPYFESEKLSPHSIKVGRLNNHALLSGLAAIAENPRLVRRLITAQSPSPSKYSFHKVKICQAGEWRHLVLDDFFPCYPLGRLMFSRNDGNEIWVPVLEKAFAKVYGGYFNLISLSVPNTLFDLTLCPVLQRDLHGEQFVQGGTWTKDGQGVLWRDLSLWKQRGYLVVAESSVHNVKKAYIESAEGLSYTILRQIEIDHSRFRVEGKESGEVTRLLELRNVWGVFENRKDWSRNSHLWTPEIIQHFEIDNSVESKRMYLPIDSFLMDFHSLSVCKTAPWNQLTIRGEFERQSHPNLTDAFHFASRILFEFKLTETTEVNIGLHQEDDGIPWVKKIKPAVDVGLWVIRTNGEDDIEVVEYLETAISRQVFCELVLPPGNYLVLPRSDGMLLGRGAFTGLNNLSIKGQEKSTFRFDAFVDELRSVSQFRFDGLSESAFSKGMSKKRLGPQESWHNMSGVGNGGFEAPGKPKVGSTKRIEELIVEFNGGPSEESSTLTIQTDSEPKEIQLLVDLPPTNHEEGGAEAAPFCLEVGVASTHGPGSQVEEPSLQSDEDRDSDDEEDPTRSPEPEPVFLDNTSTDFQHVIAEIFKKIDIMSDGRVSQSKIREFFDRKYPEFAESCLQKSSGSSEAWFNLETFCKIFREYFGSLSVEHRAVCLFKLGFTPALLCFDSRLYSLTFHSNAHFKVQSKLMSQETFDLELLAMVVVKQGLSVPLPRLAPVSDSHEPSVTVKVLKNRSTQ